MTYSYFSETPIAADVERAHFIVPPDCGGVAGFEGIVRNHNHGRSVSHIVYEAYETLAAKEVDRILEEARKQWPLKAVHVKHRIGHLHVGDTAVVICAAAPHRKEAFLGCQYIIDELKQRVPIWKKEFYRDGSHDWSYCREHHQEGPTP